MKWPLQLDLERIRDTFYLFRAQTMSPSLGLNSDLAKYKPHREKGVSPEDFSGVSRESPWGSGRQHC